MGTPFRNFLLITHKIESGRIAVRLSLLCVSPPSTVSDNRAKAAVQSFLML